MRFYLLMLITLFSNIDLVEADEYSRDPIAGLCISDSCVVDMDCAKTNKEFSCICCESNPKKQQVHMLVCLDLGKPDKKCQAPEPEEKNKTNKRKHKNRKFKKKLNKKS
jgi:hypothetical protein